LAESFRSRRFRWVCNLFPAFRGTGGRVTYVEAEFRELHVRLPLNWRTRNYVGTIFGGSLYGAVDPFYMILLMQRLGKGYTVWDKAAAIRFRRPGRATLYARFVVDDAEVAQIRRTLESEASVDRVYTVDLTDRQGVVHATVEKTVYIRKKIENREL
jgi:acyl-coenzyme A thioesterase PaaI-like protein